MPMPSACWCTCSASATRRSEPAVQLPSAAETRWALAAQALVEGCLDLDRDDDRVALLAQVCHGLGDELYPAFLRVLWVIGRQGDHAARAAVAEALVHAIRTGRLPSGRRAAWGASGGTSGAFGATRSLGPIEYLCAWRAQAEGREALSDAAFESAAESLMELVATSRDARLLYGEKLLADVDDPIAGALTRPTRQALRALATAWLQGAPAREAVQRFVAALPDNGTLSLAARVSSFVGQMGPV